MAVMGSTMIPVMGPIFVNVDRLVRVLNDVSKPVLMMVAMPVALVSVLVATPVVDVTPVSVSTVVPIAVTTPVCDATEVGVLVAAPVLVLVRDSLALPVATDDPVPVLVLVGEVMLERVLTPVLVIAVATADFVVVSAADFVVVSGAGFVSSADLVAVRRGVPASRTAVAATVSVIVLGTMPPRDGPPEPSASPSLFVLLPPQPINRASPMPPSSPFKRFIRAPLV